MAIDKLSQKLHGGEVMKERIDEMVNMFEQMKSMIKVSPKNMNQCTQF
jgi:hypothetical protein